MQSLSALRKRERADVIQQRLNEIYPETPVPLDHSDPFTLLIAVLLSAQCTDKKVNEVTPALFNAGPDPLAMAELEEAEILGHIRQLGLAKTCLLYTSPSPRDVEESRMPSSA